VLLQPELLDSYASALISAAKSEPEGLGFIPEDEVLAGRFRIPKDERVEDLDIEKLILVATLEELLRNELVLKESTDAGADLVFPSQFTRERPDAPELPGKSIMFSFEAPVLNVYATLAVRLSRSQFFRREAMWKNVATFAACAGGTCGIYLREIDEAQGELTLFFDEKTSEETRFHFEEYVAAHILRRALPGSVTRRRISVCPDCGESVTFSQAQRRRERGFRSIRCNVCDCEISLLDREERLSAPVAPAVAKMDRAADFRRRVETVDTILKGKERSQHYDVFLCYDSRDESTVNDIGQQLRRRGILPWMDKWHVRPGHRWQRELEKIISTVGAVAVFVNPTRGVDRWQKVELESFIEQFVERDCKVIPVILTGPKGHPELPVFLRQFQAVDFRRSAAGIEGLIWGILGESRMEWSVGPDMGIED
jgi:hypothetical protein